jgi:choline monooxygenase
MDRAQLIREVESFDPSIPIERAWTPPASWYTSPAIHDLELRGIMARSWQPVARVEHLNEAGAYVTGVLAGEPWALVRGADGTLRAFHNTCRHKGREVVQGCGRADELVCGYHAWTYDHQGQLRSAPRMAGIEDFDRSSMSLTPLALEIWGHWVFLNLDSEAAPLAPSLAPLESRLAATGWEKLSCVDQRTWTIESNWKVVVDNYLDGGYHIPHMHPTLDAQLDMQSYRTEVFEGYSIQSSGAGGATDERIEFEATDRIGDEALYIWLHPNFMLNRYGPCLDTNHVIPLGPNRCQVVYEFFFLETEGEGVEEFIRTSMEQASVTQKEDIAICESVQLGLNSRGYDRGRYAPRVEMGEHHFHRLVAEGLRRELEA